MVSGPPHSFLSPIHTIHTYQRSKERTMFAMNSSLMHRSGACSKRMCSASKCMHASSRSSSSSRRRRSARAEALPGDLLLYVPAMCFDQACQANADRSFLAALAVPLVAAAAAAAYLLRPPPQELKDSGQLFEDETTGFVFQSPEGAPPPELDKDGHLAFRAISYTPWPVPADFEGERLRIDVGPVADRKPRTFVFNKLLPQSQLIAVTLPRPFGIFFEYDAQRKRAVVAGVVEGSPAEQRRRVAGLNPALAQQAVQDGDVLRAVTATNFVYSSRALFGAVPPERHVVVYGADKQRWSNIKGALRKGEPTDGPVTLILERPVPRDA